MKKQPKDLISIKKVSKIESEKAFCIYVCFLECHLSNGIPALNSSVLRSGGGGGVPRTASADTLSRNISIIPENLFKRYEQSQLPTHGQGIPTVVQTNILIRSMGPVSELDVEYSMDCYFRQYWRDKRLSFKGPIKSLSLSIKMLSYFGVKFEMGSTFARVSIYGQHWSRGLHDRPEVPDRWCASDSAAHNLRRERKCCP